MVDYLTHYYLRETGPFRSLSALSGEDAIEIMQGLCDDTAFGTRFKDPAQYLRNRRETESWVREAFITKGRKPEASYPIAMVLGSSQWLVENGPDRAGRADIRIPLSILTKDDVSFTYPDSMISRWFGREKPVAYHQPELHGKIFTLPEILSITALKGMPEEDWNVNLPDDLAPYIEAQVWNHEVLFAFRKSMDETRNG